MIRETIKNILDRSNSIGDISCDFFEWGKDCFVGLGRGNGGGCGRRDCCGCGDLNRYSLECGKKYEKGLGCGIGFYSGDAFGRNCDSWICG